MHDVEIGLIWAALLTAVAGAAIAGVCAPRIIDMLLQTVGPRANYRRRPTAFPAGLALIMGAVGGPVAVAIVSPKAWPEPLCTERAAVLSFAWFGHRLAVIAGHDHSGFRGHLAMRRAL